MKIRRSTEPDRVIFRHCKNHAEKLNRLAELYGDALEWRSEESQLLRQFRQRLEKMELILEDLKGGSYMMITEKGEK